MRKIYRRFLAVLMSLAMLLCAVPAYAAGNGEETLPDDGQKLYVQDYDAEAGKDGSQCWYPDDNGIIAIPLLDRSYHSAFGSFGIHIKGDPELDLQDNVLALDFSGIYPGYEGMVRVDDEGLVTLLRPVKQALEEKTAADGFAEVPLTYSTGEGQKIAEVTLRFTDSHDESEEPSKPEIPEAVQSVMDLISAIGEVTADSGDAIAAARAAYNALNAEEQGQVSNYSVLTAAEEMYESLTAEEPEEPGDPETAVEIYDEAGLRNMTAEGSYRLMSDITLSEAWTPVRSFAGTLDGNGHVIRGLNITVTENTGVGVGFFASTAEGAVIRDMGLEGTIRVSNASADSTGALVGSVWGTTSISGCYTNVEISTGTMANAGGIAGTVEAACTIENCYAAGSITGGSWAYVGGIAGQLNHSGAAVRSVYTTFDRAVEAYTRWNEAESGCIFSVSGDKHAEAIPEDMDTFLTALNGDGEAFAADEAGLNTGYPVLPWQNREEAAVKVWYTLPGKEAAEVQAGGVIYLTPDQSGQVQLSFEGVPEGQSDAAEFRFGSADFRMEEGFLYFDTQEGSSSVQVVVPGGGDGQSDTVLFTFQIRVEEAKEPVISYTNGYGESKTLENGYRFAVPLGGEGTFASQNVSASAGWVSSDPQVASIAEDGALKAEGAGEAVLSLEDEDGTVLYSCMVEVADVKVYYTDDSGTKEEVTRDGEFTLPLTANGTFILEGYAPGESKAVTWEILDEESWNKDISIGSGGSVWITGEDTVQVGLLGRQDGSFENDFSLFRFTLKAVSCELEEIRVTIDGKEISAGGTHTVQGSESTEIQVSGRYVGEENFVNLTNASYTVSGSSNMEVSTYGDGKCYVIFQEPGEGTLTIHYGEGKDFSFTLVSEYVPVQEILLDLPETKALHRLTYAMGYGDNYVGLTQMDLSAALTVVPSNASYARSVQWASSNEAVATYEPLHNNGIQGHSAGTTTVTASVQDGDKIVSCAKDVTFRWQYPIEKLEAETAELTVQVGETISLPIIYTPEQPSQALIHWSQEGEGEVSVTRGVNGDYDSYSNKNYYVTGVEEGTVTITGTPVAPAEGADPSVTFTIHVEGSGERPELPDTTELINTWKDSIQQYYGDSSPSWDYGTEWNIIALERAGMDMGVDKDAYLASVKEELADEYGDLTPGGKPTDLERTALAMYALGLDPTDIVLEDGSTVNLIRWILDSERVSEGSNEAAYALLALDASQEEVPEGSRWSRDTLIEELLSFQAEDGSFVLSKPVTGTGSVDMTAMSLQALSRYTDREDVQAAVEKALDYLKARISMGDYGTAESNDQVIITLLMLGIDPSSEESGFTSWSANLFTATDQYRVESGGFSHVKGGAVNEMATQQTLLAVAAWERYAAGENDIYDMTDVKGGSEPSEDPAAADAVVKQIQALPAADGLTLSDKEAVEAARAAYNALTDEQKTYVPKESVAILEACEKKIQELEAAEKPETASVTIAVEKFTIGQGYLIDPVQVEISEGTTTAEVLDSVLEENGLRYDHTGSVESGFYLSWILDEAGSLTAELPEISQKYAEENGITVTNPRKRDTLGEFDYTSQSGWMYTLNNEFPDVGMSDTVLKDGDVIRIRFSAMGYGADLCSENDYVTSFVPIVNGDSMTKLLAEFNGREDREELMAYANVQKAYAGAVAAISNIAGDQSAVNAAEQALKDAVASPSNPAEPEIPAEAQAVMDQIDRIGTVTLGSREAIEAARAAYSQLTAEQQSYVTNYAVLEAAEAELQALQEQAADQAAADAVTKQIEALPGAEELTLSDKEAVEAARSAYDALTDQQKQYVTGETVAALEARESKIQELEESEVTPTPTPGGEPEEPEVTPTPTPGEEPEEPGVTPTPTPEEDGEVTLTYQNYPISITGKGLSGYELKLEALTASDSDVKRMQKEITSKEALIRLYDVALCKDGQEVQPQEAVTLSIQVGEKYDGKTLSVLHVVNGQVETLTGTVADGVLKVTVTALGKFGTVVDASTVSTGGTGTGAGSSGTGNTSGTGAGSTTGTGSVQTGDMTDVLPYVSALIAAAGAGVILAVYGRKRNAAEK